jgi:DNA polymerase-3 subunit alpha
MPEKYPGNTEFCHLHNHTIFSVLDGIASPDDYFKGCAERKWPAFAITEHGVFSSIPDAYFASKKYGVKQIVGCEFYLNDYDRQRKAISEQETGRINEWKKNNVDFSNRLFRNRHLTVLAKNSKGYDNLMRLNIKAWDRGFYRKPRIKLEWLAKHNEGLIVLSGCLNGPVSHELRNRNFTTTEFTGAVEYIKQYKSIFKDDYYVELQMPGITGDIEVFKQLVMLANKFKIKTVITNDCHYKNRDDYKLQKIMMAIDQKTTVDDPDLFHVNSDEQFFKTRAELRETFFERGYFAAIKDKALFEKSCDNTLEVAEKCEPFKPNLEPKLPIKEDAGDKLRSLVLEGLRKKGFDKDDTKYLYDEREITYTEQAEIELERIIEKGFASYFLITIELIEASVREGWPVGPGRGSVSGSLVSYLIGIHNLDPIKWKLSFNRFLSPARGGNMLKVTLD